MATAIALLGFNDLGRSVIPKISFQKLLLFTIIPTLPKNEQKNQCGKFKISVRGTWHPAILRLQGT